MAVTDDESRLFAKRLKHAGGGVHAYTDMHFLATHAYHRCDRRREHCRIAAYACELQQPVRWQPRGRVAHTSRAANNNNHEQQH